MFRCEDFNRSNVSDPIPHREIVALSSLMILMTSQPSRLIKTGERMRNLVLRGHSPEKAVEGTIIAAEAMLGRGPFLDAK